MDFLNQNFKNDKNGKPLCESSKTFFKSSDIVDIAWECANKYVA